MVDPGETVSATLRREFGEEALNLQSSDPARTARLRAQLDRLFQHGRTVYKGYVDDPRNTDQAWMETIVTNFHDETGDAAAALPLHAGDDAAAVRWMPITPDLRLYASHRSFVGAVCAALGAHAAGAP